jgi:hypothetical protein
VHTVQEPDSRFAVTKTMFWDDKDDLRSGCAMCPRATPTGESGIRFDPELDSKSRTIQQCAAPTGKILAADVKGPWSGLAMGDAGLLGVSLPKPRTWDCLD